MRQFLKRRVHWKQLHSAAGVVLLATLLVLSIGILSGEPFDIYLSEITSEKQVYDGDTIQDVRIQILDLNNKVPAGELWPGVFLTSKGTIEIQTHIRINGIDTPEKRTSKKNRDGTLRSDESRSNEKYAAAQSRLVLLNLLRENQFKFVVSNPMIGKYAGRMVATVTIDGVDVAQFLIENGNALPYDGGRKTELNWEKLSDGKMR